MDEDNKMEDGQEQGGQANGADRGGMPERKMYQGDWKCGNCQAEIKELPFEPDPARMDKLLCRDCHKQRVQSFRRPNFR